MEECLRILVVFSCSNDTTIKLWSLKNVYEQGAEDNFVNNLSSLVTLNDDSDYVRAIDYSANLNSLYSCCDNGTVRQWDVELGKIVSEYSANVGLHLLRNYRQAKIET